MNFEKTEYLTRVKNTQQSMSELGIDVLIITDPANMAYLSGYDGWSFYVHQCLLVSLTLDEPIWIGRQQDANGARITTDLSAENIIGYQDDYVQSTVKHPMDFVSTCIKEKGWGNLSIGVETDNYYFTAACYHSLEKNLGSGVLKDANCLVNWVRAIKSETEIGYMRQAARIVEQTMQTAIDRIKPGVRQCDVVADILHTGVSGTPEYGGDYTSIVPLLPTGVKASAPHITWSDQRFVEGEGTILELAGCRLRYHCPMARTIFLGTPPKKFIDAESALIEGIQNALDAVKPGATCEEVELAWRHTIAKYGIEKESRIGYSIGLNYPPDWGEHTMSLRSGDLTVLKPNMTFHMIPGLWMDDFGLEISEVFRVTETGVETLCNYPRKLFVK